MVTFWARQRLDQPSDMIIRIGRLDEIVETLDEKRTGLE